LNPQHCESQAPQIPITTRVMLCASFGEMVFAVNLDIQFQIQANEIKRVMSERMLASEFRTKDPTSAYHLPNRI